jgi:hypothetical protein
MFAAAWLASFVLTSLLYGGGAPLRIYLGAFVLLLAATLFLLCGSRVAWILFALGNGAALLSVLLSGEWGWGIFHLALLAVLFAPQARRYVWHHRV